MGDNLVPKAPQSLPPKTAPDVRPKTAIEKLSAEDQAAIKKLSSNTNILNADKNTAEGIEKAIIVAGQTINQIRGKMDDLFYGKFEIAVTEDTGSANPITGFKETLDKGIFYVMDKLLEVDMCNILDYALNQIPGGKKFDPNVSPDSIDDPLARKKYEIQLKAYQVQVLIDDFYSLYGDNSTSKKKNALVGLIKKVRTILEEVLGIQPEQALSPEQQIEQESSELTDALTTDQRVQDVKELLGTDGLRDAELVSAFPELQLFSNYLEDVYRVFNRYSDVRNFPNQDVQKALKKIDDIRTIAISIQNLTTVSGAINLADRFLDGKISKFIKMISKIIDPKRIIPFLKTIMDVCRVIIRIANQILRVISFFSKIITLFLLLVKIFWILRKFFMGIPIPNLVTTVGVTTTVSDTLQEIIKEKGFLTFLKRLKQINQLLQIIIKFLSSLVTKLFALVEKITALIFNIESCFTDPNELLDDPSTLQSELDQYGLDQLASGGTNINPNSRSGGGTAGGRNAGGGGIGAGAGVGVGGGAGGSGGIGTSTGGGTGGGIGVGGGLSGGIATGGISGNASGLNNSRGIGTEASNTNISGRVSDANSTGNGFGVVGITPNINELNARRVGTYIDPALLQEFKDVRDLLRDRAQRLLEFLNNYFDKKNAKNNTFGPYTIEILTEVSVDTEIRLRRRYGIAIDANGVIAAQSEATYASDDKIIIAEVKAKLLSLGLVNTNALGYSQKSNLILNGLGGTNANGVTGNSGIGAGGNSGLDGIILTGLGDLGASKQGQNINQNGGTSQTLGLNGIASSNQTAGFGVNGMASGNSGNSGNFSNQSSAANRTNVNGSPSNIPISNGSSDGFGVGLDAMITNVDGDDYGKSFDSFLSEDAKRKQSNLEGQKAQSGGNQPNLGFSGFSASDVAVMEESMNFLTEDDINIDDIEFMDFETGDDDPDSEDDDPPSGLGLNGFINSIKGGKKLRKRMRKMMAKSSSDLANNLKQADSSGKYGGKIAAKQANKEEIAEKKNKISDLKDQIATWKKERAASLLLGPIAFALAKKVLDPKIKKNEEEIKKLEAEIKQLEGGQPVNNTNQAAQTSTAATGGKAESSNGTPVTYAGSGGSYSGGGSSGGSEANQQLK
jgi:hypothetical protein